MDLSRRGLAPVRRCLDAGDIAGGREAAVRYFRTRRRPHWFFDLRDGRRGQAWNCWYGPDPDTMRRAREALANRLDIGAEKNWVIDCGPKLKWVTPETLSSGIPGNIFKRCQFMVDLAAAHARTRQKRYAVKLNELIGRWIRDWPMLVDPDVKAGQNLLCRMYGYKAMPTGFRCFAWLDVIYSGALFAREIPASAAFSLIRSLWFAAWQFRRFAAEGYKPANHHLWHGGVVPFVLGAMLPEFPELARMQEQGKAVVAEHARRSFLSDGSYEERSSGYTLVALNMFSLAAVTARLNRISLLTPSERRAVRSGFNVLAGAVLPHGLPADVGDSVPALRKTAVWIDRGYTVFKSRACAAVIENTDLKRFVPEELFRREIPSLPEMPPASCRRGAGVLVARDRWSPDASAMVLTVPDGGLRNHAHADALNLQLVVRGVPIVGTPISRLHWLSARTGKAGETFSRYFRGCASHNVVLANGVPEENRPPHYQAEPVSAVLEWKRRRKGIEARASRRLQSGGDLCREVMFYHGSGWTVRDRVLESPGKPHRLLWHLEQGVELTGDGDAFLARSGNSGLRITFESQGSLRVSMRREKPMTSPQGWSGTDCPWILDVFFGGSSDDIVTTRFKIMQRQSFS